MGSRGKNSVVAGIAAGCILVCMAIVGPNAGESARGTAIVPAHGRGPEGESELETPARRPVPSTPSAAEAAPEPGNAGR